MMSKIAARDRRPWWMTVLCTPRVRVTVWGGVAVLGVASVAMTFYMTKGSCATQAIKVAGWGSIGYVMQKGTWPRTVDDLFAAGILRTREDGWVSAEVSGVVSASCAEVKAVKLRFPESTDGWQLVDGRVVRTSTGVEGVFMEIPGCTLPAEARSMNRWFAKLWFQVESGMNTGLLFLDDAISSQPGRP